MIDLSKYLNTVDVDAEAKAASVQGGAIWEQVDNATSVYDLGTVGGTVSTVSTSNAPTL